MSEHAGSKALSFQEPWATGIMLGKKTVECRSKNIKTPVRNLVVCASKTPTQYYPILGLVYGYAIGLVDIVDCVPFAREHLRGALMDEMPGPNDHAWILENSRPIKPFPVHASAGFWYVEDPIKLVKISTPKDYLRVYGDIVCPEDPGSDLTIGMVLDWAFGYFPF